MRKGLTYFWLIMFVCSLNSVFAMNPDLHIKTNTSKLTEMSCCCDHSGNESCSKQCCNENDKSSDENECQGQCGNTSSQCTSISINIVSLPNENLIAISEFIEYTFETPSFGYLESIPQPIAMPIWQPPQQG